MPTIQCHQCDEIVEINLMEDHMLYRHPRSYPRYPLKYRKSSNTKLFKETKKVKEGFRKPRLIRSPKYILGASILMYPRGGGGIITMYTVTTCAFFGSLFKGGHLFKRGACSRGALIRGFRVLVKFNLVPRAFCHKRPWGQGWVNLYSKTMS